MTTKIKFKKLLRQSGWTQVEAAHHLKVTSNYIHLIVKGDSVPSETLLESLKIKVRLGHVSDILNGLSVLTEKTRRDALAAMKGIADYYTSRWKNQKANNGDLQGDHQRVKTILN